MEDTVERCASLCSSGSQILGENRVRIGDSRDCISLDVTTFKGVGSEVYMRHINITSRIANLMVLLSVPPSEREFGTLGLS